MKFDRDIHPYVQTGSRRYAHHDCYLREQEKNGITSLLDIIDPSDKITCCYCKEIFSKKENPDYIMISKSRFCHKKCYELEQIRPKTDAEKLDAYLQNLYDQDYVPPNIQRQIKKFIEDYDYTYGGILGTLVYWFDVKHNPPKANTIGIVPYIYQEAKEYFTRLAKIQKSNEIKEVKPYEQIEIHIKPPQRNVAKRPLFTFLDEEVDK